MSWPMGRVPPCLSSEVFSCKLIPGISIFGGGGGGGGGGDLDGSLFLGGGGEI